VLPLDTSGSPIEQGHRSPPVKCLWRARCAHHHTEAVQRLVLPAQGPRQRRVDRRGRSNRWRSRPRLARESPKDVAVAPRLLTA